MTYPWAVPVKNPLVFFLKYQWVNGAEGGIRTPTPRRALDPEPSASASSATSA